MFRVLKGFPLRCLATEYPQMERRLVCKANERSYRKCYWETKFLNSLGRRSQLAKTPVSRDTQMFSGMVSGELKVSET